MVGFKERLYAELKKKIPNAHRYDGVVCGCVHCNVWLVYSGFRVWCSVVCGCVHCNVWLVYSGLRVWWCSVVCGCVQYVCMKVTISVRAQTYSPTRTKYTHSYTHTQYKHTHTHAESTSTTPVCKTNTLAGLVAASSPAWRRSRTRGRFWRTEREIQVAHTHTHTNTHSLSISLDTCL
jgi:hypothetical protein